MSSRSSPCLTAALLLSLLVLLHAPIVLADSSVDSSRLGTEYTALNLLRTGSGSNVFSVGVGTPSIEVNLTVCECALTCWLSAGAISGNADISSLYSDDCGLCGGRHRPV
jgi:hypothetical protein